MTLSDQKLTALQERGRVNVWGCSAAEVVEACDTLGIDPREATLHPGPTLVVGGSLLKQPQETKLPEGRTMRPTFPARANLGSLEARAERLAEAEAQALREQLQTNRGTGESR